MERAKRTRVARLFADLARTIDGLAAEYAAVRSPEAKTLAVSHARAEVEDVCAVLAEVLTDGD